MRDGIPQSQTTNAVGDPFVKSLLSRAAIFRFQLEQLSSYPPLKMHFTFLYGLAALAAWSSALVVPASNVRQTSIGKLAKDDDDYDLEPTASFAFAGITSFAKLPSVQCLTETGPVDDILILGFPFDTATSYRTGTRLGPNAVRQGSRAASLACV